jgi:hypothetical protein
MGSQVIDVLEAQEIKETGKEEVGTAAARQIRKFSEHKLTIGLDLGDRSSVFGSTPRCPIALENGDALALSAPIAERTGIRMAYARNVSLIGENRKKDDRLDARTLARLA